MWLISSLGGLIKNFISEFFTFDMSFDCTSKLSGIVLDDEYLLVFLREEFMKKLLQSVVAGAPMLSGTTSMALATDSVNVAFFLEWATPNQIAKVDKAYDDAMGVDVNWTDFSTGVAMTEAMLAGDIDIAYSQGLAPFVTAIQQGAPLKMVGIAVVYEANDCFVANNLGISSANASELEGATVAVPLNTMADFSFRKQMAALGVDTSTMTIVDQAPADGAVSLADGSVAMACIFGGASAKAAGEVGTPIMSSQEKVDAGIGSFDVVSVTEKFATENPDLLRTFLRSNRRSKRSMDCIRRSDCKGCGRRRYVS